MYAAYEDRTRVCWGLKRTNTSTNISRIPSEGPAGANGRDHCAFAFFSDSGFLNGTEMRNEYSILWETHCDCVFAVRSQNSSGDGKKSHFRTDTHGCVAMSSSQNFFGCSVLLTRIRMKE